MLQLCYRSQEGSSPAPHVLLILSALLESMPPQTPKALSRAMRPKQRAKALARSRRTESHNARRASRERAMKTLNTLASELAVPVSPLLLRSATGDEVEKRVRLLEARLSNPDQLQRLRSAAKLYVDSGGSFSAPVVPEDHNTPSPVGRHRVLQPNYKLKSKAFMATYNSAQIAPSCWQRFQDFTVALKQKHGARAWAACLEESEHSAEQGRHHLHNYFFWTDGVGIECETLADFYFEGIRPRIDVCVTRCTTTSPLSAAQHGLWYVSFVKDGTLESATNYPSGQWYKPQATWLQSLYAAGKLRYSSYITTSATLFPIGHSARKRDADEALRDLRSNRVMAHVDGELARLQKDGAYHPPRSYPMVEEFIGMFADKAMWRRPILLILGGTNMGKSILGGNILERIAGKLSLVKGSYLEVTVETDGHLDLADFDLDAHGGVLLDGLGDIATLKANRESLQGRPKITKGARSATMKHAYPYTFARRAIVATSDLSAANIDMLTSDHWLADPRNVLVLRLTEPAWVDQRSQATMQTMPAETREVMMRRWLVKDVSSFLDKADLKGPAAVLYANGVSGKDLAELGVDSLVAELRLSAFAARKIIAARDAFLAVA